MSASDGARDRAFPRSTASLAPRLRGAARGPESRVYNPLRRPARRLGRARAARRQARACEKPSPDGGGARAVPRWRARAAVREAASCATTLSPPHAGDLAREALRAAPSIATSCAPILNTKNDIPPPLLYLAAARDGMGCYVLHFVRTLRRAARVNAANRRGSRPAWTAPWIRLASRRPRALPLPDALWRVLRRVPRRGPRWRCASLTVGAQLFPSLPERRRRRAERRVAGPATNCHL